MKVIVADREKEEQWIEELPHSRVSLPKHPTHRAKYLFWRVITPVHPRMRRIAERIGFRRELFVAREYKQRQRFLLGTVAPGQSMQELVLHLVNLGYGNHFIAWHDEGQVVSLRLIENFTHQYHLRIFKDGEVRGHYEYTPECYPLKHVKAIGQEDRRDVFYKHLGERIIRSSK